MEQAATQTIYYLVAGGAVLVGAIIAILLRIEARGRWKGEMEAHKSEMTEHKALVVNFMETINNRLIEIFDRLHPAVVAGSSRLRLTRLGETIAEELRPNRLISSMADTVEGQVSSMQPYDVQEFCKYHIHEVFKPDEEQDAKIKACKACAFDHGLEDRQVLDVPVVLLRDELLSRNERVRDQKP